MSKLYSTVSRRDFMKGLGLAGAGLGAAAAAAPVFHDLDEMTGSPSALWRRPWYVQEVEKPTAEVDWNVMPFFDDRETLFDNGAFARAVGTDEIGRIFALNAEHTRTWIAQDKPGATLRDVALDSATGFGFAYGLQGNWVPQQIVSTPEDNGAKRIKAVEIWIVHDSEGNHLELKAPANKELLIETLCDALKIASNLEFQKKNSIIERPGFSNIRKFGT